MNPPAISATADEVALPDAPSRARPTPLGIGPVRWVRENLFRGWLSTAVTLLTLYLLITWGMSLISWGFLNAVWTVPGTGQSVDTSACRAVKGVGACWAIVGEKWRFVLFGVYPYAEHWRPAICIGLFVGLYVVSAQKRFWRKELALVWIGILTLIGVLMWGGILGMPFVEQDRWGGLMITLILSTFGIALAFPLGILVALGRRSNLPAVKLLCILYVELIRGVPLISILFMASVMFPLFLPEGVNIDKLLRAQIAIILFAAAYQAEVVRGGLQALSRGQYEAADALGLSYWQKTGMIILPQALRIVIPPLVNNFIGMFKDTSLVLIIGIFDLLNTGKTAVIEPAWQGFGPEVYLFVASIYFVFCFAMSKYSQGVEADIGQHGKR